MERSVCEEISFNYLCSKLRQNGFSIFASTSKERKKEGGEKKREDSDIFTTLRHKAIDCEGRPVILAIRILSKIGI